VMLNTEYINETLEASGHWENNINYLLLTCKSIY
jgi:hypothetical protein